MCILRCFCLFDSILQGVEPFMIFFVKANICFSLTADNFKIFGEVSVFRSRVTTIFFMCFFTNLIHCLPSPSAASLPARMPLTNQCYSLCTNIYWMYPNCFIFSVIFFPLYLSPLFTNQSSTTSHLSHLASLPDSCRLSVHHLARRQNCNQYSFAQAMSTIFFSEFPYFNDFPKAFELTHRHSLTKVFFSRRSLNVGRSYGYRPLPDGSEFSGEVIAYQCALCYICIYKYTCGIFIPD